MLSQASHYYNNFRLF